MAYSFAPLLVRILSYLLLGTALAVVLFLWTKKHTMSLRITISIVVFSVFLVYSFSSIYSLINPQVKTIMCTYVDFQSSADQINPLSVECELLCEGETVYLELDTLTQQMVLHGIEELEKGKAYIFTYEERENLILGIQES